MMNTRLDLKDMNITGDSLMPGFSVDCVIFAFNDGCMKVLLNKFRLGEQWMLPGSFVPKDKNVDYTASYILKLKTGIEDAFLRQFHLFGDTDRSDHKDNQQYAKQLELNEENTKWFNQRFITIAYYAFVKFDEYKAESKNIEDDVEWVNLKDIPQLYADHNKIVEKAIETIRMQLGFIPIGFELLPEKFTIPELRTIYEIIIGKELDRRNFQRKILSLGYIKRLNETRKSGAHKAPQLYSFDKVKYKMARKYGIQVMSWNLHDASL